MHNNNLCYRPNTQFNFKIEKEQVKDDKTKYCKAQSNRDRGRERDDKKIEKNCINSVELFKLEKSNIT